MQNPYITTRNHTHTGPRILKMTFPTIHRMPPGICPRIILSLLPFLVFFSRTSAQQVQCTINVNYEAVSTTHKDLLGSLRDELSEYINNSSWGDDQFEEPISCEMSVFVQNAIGENRYSAQVVIVSQRQILGSDRSSPVVRIKDESWEFNYIRNRPISHNLSSFDEVASFLDYYVYIILGYDYDTYEDLGGSKWFAKAADVANLGRSSGQKGWQNTTGSYSRTQLIDEILNPKFTPARSAIYTYHFAGLDSLNINRTTACKRMLSALEAVGLVRRVSDPRSLAIKAFFEAKYLEIADKLLKCPGPSAYPKLIAIDPSHQTTYEEYQSKRE